MKKILFIFGTRPEAIKLAPLIKIFQKNKSQFQTVVCSTGQHQEMLAQVLDFFKIKTDCNLKTMVHNQTLFDITANNLLKLETVFKQEKPDLAIVQGDTSSAFIGALAAFYTKTKIAHLEAGLRSFNKYQPFPEEKNRELISHLADFHFAPTKKAVNNLAREGIKEQVWQVGNTVIDALLMAKKQLNTAKMKQKFAFIKKNKKYLLLTSHRRENLGEPLQNICQAAKKIIKENKNTEIIFPVHLNPNVQKIVKQELNNNKKIHLIEPQPYPELVYLMDQAYLILTDSGGIQEEGPSLAKPVLVLRQVTERIEGIKASTAKLVGTNKNKIFKETSKLLNNEQAYQEMAQAVNPYGRGDSAYKILKIIQKNLL